ncbi:hypothetical protein C1645_778152 [Glomus cerebriforme]|uniref:Galactose oxidase n=1 Tax=Glomus cerebriforme TaxID=658196 RepID=A0A397SVW8_9GLOM|nr:hypothetical protein C1645_778152 [Glomus cerebriforme]
MIFLGNLIYIAIGILFQIEITKTFFFGGEHTTTFINDKLYIIGNDAASKRELILYLDVSVSFDTNELKWNDLTNIIKNNIVPPNLDSASIKGGENNNTLFLIGGVSELNTTAPGFTSMAPVYAFDTQSNSWSIPQLVGIPPTEITGISNIVPTVDYNGLVYLFGGLTFFDATVVNDLFILNTINFSLKKASSINAPSARIDYGVVFLPNKKIIYMGGTDGFQTKFAPETVYLYDTINDIWTTKTTYGLIPGNRDSFTTVLGLDGQRVILFGGNAVESDNSIHVLDINNFFWYVPKVSGKIPSSRFNHKAVIIDKYMVVTFGNGYTQANESDILLLDISNNDEYVWTTSFDLNNKNDTTFSTPSASTPSVSNPSGSRSLPQSAIIGIVIGSILVLIILTALTIYLFKLRKFKLGERTKDIPHAIEVVH